MQNQSDIWTIREQLCLACSVLRLGEKNWINISRTLKYIFDKSSVLSNEWFSQKLCAQQYAYLLENMQVPRRKKRESDETNSEFITRRLTEDRLFELTEALSTGREEFEYLKNEIDILKKKSVSNEQLNKMWKSIKEEIQNFNDIKIDYFLLPVEERSVYDQKNRNSLEADTIDSECIKNKINKHNKIDNESCLLTNPLKSIGTSDSQKSEDCSSSNDSISNKIIELSIPMRQSSSVIHPLLTSRDNFSSDSAPISLISEKPFSNLEKKGQSLVNNSNNFSIDEPKIVEESMSRNSSLSTLQVNTFPFLKHHLEHDVSSIQEDETNNIVGRVEQIFNQEIKQKCVTVTNQLNFSNKVDNLPNTHKSSIVTLDFENDNDSRSSSAKSDLYVAEIDSSSSNIAEIIGTSIEKDSEFQSCGQIELLSNNSVSSTEKNEKSSEGYIEVSKTIEIKETSLNVFGAKGDDIQNTEGPRESNDQKIHFHKQTENFTDRKINQPSSPCIHKDYSRCCDSTSTEVSEIIYILPFFLNAKNYI